MVDSIISSPVTVTRKWFQWSHFFSFDNTQTGIKSATFWQSQTPIENDVYKWADTKRPQEPLTIVFDSAEKFAETVTFTGPVSGQEHTMAVGDLMEGVAAYYVQKSPVLPNPDGEPE